MNKPNPLVPQGTFADKGKAHIRITVFAILAVHVVLLGVLLIAGCNKKATDGLAGDPGLPPTPPPLTNDTPVAPAQWPGPPGANLAGGNVPVPPPVPNIPPIPQPTIDPALPPAASVTEHTVVKGDSFYTLGKQYKVGTKAIADANPNVDSTKLRLGQKLKIPAPKAAADGGAAVAPGSSSLAPAGASADTTYTVKSGDNLIKIAKAHGLTPKEVQRANGLRTTQIRVGQKLKIPGKTPAAPPEPAAPPPGIPAPAPEGIAPPIRS